MDENVFVSDGFVHCTMCRRDGEMVWWWWWDGDGDGEMALCRGWDLSDLRLCGLMALNTLMAGHTYPMLFITSPSTATAQPTPSLNKNLHSAFHPGTYQHIRSSPLQLREIKRWDWKVRITQEETKQDGVCMRGDMCAHVGQCTDIRQNNVQGGGGREHGETHRGQFCSQSWDKTSQWREWTGRPINSLLRILRVFQMLQ